MRLLELMGAFAVLACGQTSTQTFSLNPGATPPQLQEAVNAVRTIADVSEVSIDTKANAFTASGKADQMALVNGW
ncbi:MAG TPA: hypothetical protein VKB88_36810 [Bryobacteraceae bacterium]|nr:hypothetical protein [Bryobacteraceae bacterium]